jgi:hypothetical protein
MKRLLVLLPLAAGAAHAQCVMCFRTAAAQQMERARILNFGIIIMLVPPVLILAGFLLLAWRRNRVYADADDKISTGETLHALVAGPGHIGPGSADD